MGFDFLTFSDFLADIFSLVIYFFMWRHFKMAVNIAEEDNGSDNSLPYGGIYMGPQEIQVEEVEIEHLPPNNNNNTNEEHKAKSVMRALGLHLKLSMADITLTCIALFICNIYVLSFFYIYQTICFFWLPFLVIRASFEKLVSVSAPLVN